MGLLDDIKNAQPRKGSKCSVPALLAALDKEDRADIEAAMADPVIASTSIVAILQREGHKIGISTIQRHRRGGCFCGFGG